MPYLYSTLSAPTEYTGWKEGGADMPTAAWSVVVNAGAGVATKHLITPVGVMTEVTAEELKLLQENDVFKRHLKNGYIKIDEKKHAVEAVVADMEARDNSAPLVEADFAEGEAPKTNVEPVKAVAPHSSTIRNNKRK